MGARIKLGALRRHADAPAQLAKRDQALAAISEWKRRKKGRSAISKGWPDRPCTYINMAA
jgi:hypothetical protein